MTWRRQSTHRYTVTNTISGTNLGIVRAANKAEALDTMSLALGYDRLGQMLEAWDCKASSYRVERIAELDPPTSLRR